MVFYLNFNLLISRHTAFARRCSLISCTCLCWFCNYFTSHFSPIFPFTFSARLSLLRSSSSFVFVQFVLISHIKHARRTRPLAATASQKLKLKFKTRAEQQQQQQLLSQRLSRQRSAAAAASNVAQTHTRTYTRVVPLACLNTLATFVCLPVFISQRNERHLRSLSLALSLSLSVIGLAIFVIEQLNLSAACRMCFVFVAADIGAFFLSIRKSFFSFLHYIPKIHIFCQIRACTFMHMYSCLLLFFFRYRITHDIFSLKKLFDIDNIVIKSNNNNK